MYVVYKTYMHTYIHTYIEPRILLFVSFVSQDMCVWSYVFIHVCVLVCVLIHAHVYIHVYMLMCIYMYTCSCVYAHHRVLFTCVYVCVLVGCIHVCVLVCVLIHAGVCIHTYIYKHIHMFCSRVYIFLVIFEPNKKSFLIFGQFRCRKNPSNV
jgi:hypothetical protein